MNVFINEHIPVAPTIPGAPAGPGPPGPPGPPVAPLGPGSPPGPGKPACVRLQDEHQYNRVIQYNISPICTFCAFPLQDWNSHTVFLLCLMTQT